MTEKKNHQAVCFRGLIAWDFAILTLDGNIEFDQYVKPVSLPSPDDTGFENADLTISGWGNNHHGKSEPKLHTAKVHLTPKQDVIKRWWTFNEEHGNCILFAGKKHSDSTISGTCDGDSGGT